jgi:hypothetical protein
MDVGYILNLLWLVTQLAVIKTIWLPNSYFERNRILCLPLFCVLR